MTRKFESVANFEKTKKLVGYVPFGRAKETDYQRLGFKCGLEIHQQLKTEKKLFCHCPAGKYQHKGDYDAEIVRHMRPTLSELGEYDGTALMEFKTRKNIYYHIKYESSCTYDIDDTPPFLLNQEALRNALKIALLLKTSIVGEIHITRKQYLDGSIPTGFQRTAILGINGEIPLGSKTVRILQLSLEEDACREVLDMGHDRVYTTDRLGTPLVETVTSPELLTPFEAAEAAHYIRFLYRSTGNVRTGIGAAREDVNVSISGGTRVEIKGVAHIKWIPRLTHDEAFRQRALLQIKDHLMQEMAAPLDWHIQSTILSKNPKLAGLKKDDKHCVVAVNLPGFRGVLSFFTQPGKCFADEISDRLQVIACLGQPNMSHSEELQPMLAENAWQEIRKDLHASEEDAQIVFWAPEKDIKTALETIEERCKLAFQGVPQETRKALPDGTTAFERVLPGPDRMYPDTDSAPIPIKESLIQKASEDLPMDISEQMKQMGEWGISQENFAYIFVRNLFPLIEKTVKSLNFDPAFVGKIVGQAMKHIEGRNKTPSDFNFARIFDLFVFVKKNHLEQEIIKVMLPEVYKHPNMDFDSVLTEIGFRPNSKNAILAAIPVLRKKFREISKVPDLAKERNWIVGKLRKMATGNMSMNELVHAVNGGQNG